MGKVKNGYKDLDKWRKMRRKQMRRYYETRRQPKSEWHGWQDKLVLEHSIPDTELAPVIGHGVRAIQIRRCRLKKGEV